MEAPASRLTPSRALQTRVINGTLYAREVQPYAYETRIHDLGNGLIEATAMPLYAWTEVDNLSPLALADYEAALASPPPLTQQELLDRAADNRAKSTRRARTTVRRLAKVKALTTMLTLTYRENMTDRSRMARDWDVFVKRVRRLFPDFEFVCVFERQKRGAWHAHVAVRKLAAFYMHKGTLVKSYDLFRALWRGVVGADNGNCHHAPQNKRIRGSISKLAGYLTKYIGKHFDGNERHANSYSASGRALPGPEVERISTSDQNEAVRALAERLLSVTGTGPMEFHQAYLDGGGYFVAIAPMSPS